MTAAGALGVAPAGPAAAATLPNAPSGLAATVVNGGSLFELDWADNSSDETGFEIQRCTTTATGCTLAPLVTVQANQTSYPDVSAVAAYRYRVRAVNAAGASAWSAEAALLSGSGAPTAVMTATPASGDAPLTVAFDGSASVVLGFSNTLRYSWSFGDGVTATGATTSHVYAAPGTYRATLTVSDSFDVANLTSTTITVSTQPPPAPTGLNGSSRVKRRIDLRWTNPAASNATSLQVHRCAGATCTVFSLVATLPVTASSWSDTAVRSGTTYRYMVTARNSLYGSSSNVVSVKAR